jgi:hypothetical protein
VLIIRDDKLGFRGATVVVGTEVEVGAQQAVHAATMELHQHQLVNRWRLSLPATAQRIWGQALEA